MKQKRKRGRKTLANGRSAGSEQYARVLFEMIRREVFRTMKGAAKGVLIELWSWFNGDNNGDLHLSVREAKKRLAIGQAAAESAFETLQQRGFIAQTRPGALIGRRAATWRLTMLPYNDAPPTYDYRNWRPKADLTPKRDPEAEALAALDAERMPPVPKTNTH